MISWNLKAGIFVHFIPQLSLHLSRL